MTGEEEAAAAGFGVEGTWPVLRRHRIRWAECDMYAHVNHAAYLTLCEDLRVSHWVSLGGRFEPGEAGPVVAQLEARYLRPLGFDDEVALTLRPGSLRRRTASRSAPSRRRRPRPAPARPPAAPARAR